MAGVLISRPYSSYREFLVKVDACQEFRHISKLPGKGLCRLKIIPVVFLKEKRIFLQNRATARRVRNDGVKPMGHEGANVPFGQLARQVGEEAGGAQIELGQRRGGVVRRVDEPAVAAAGPLSQVARLQKQYVAAPLGELVGDGAAAGAAAHDHDLGRVRQGSVKSRGRRCFARVPALAASTTAPTPARSNC